MSLPEIDLTGFQRDHEAEQRFDRSGLTIACIIAIVLGMSLMVWSLTTGQGFGPAFWTGFSLTIATCTFAGHFEAKAARHCSGCGRDAEPHLADLDDTNSSGLLMSIIKKTEVNGRWYMRDPDAGNSPHDYQLGWTRLMCVVGACEHCLSYTVITSMQQVPLNQQDELALLELETGYSVT